MRLRPIAAGAAEVPTYREFFLLDKLKKAKNIDALGTKIAFTNCFVWMSGKNNFNS
jgi:hypothetical protein